MAFRNPSAIAQEIIKNARFQKRGDKDGFDGRPVVEPRWFVVVPKDVVPSNVTAVFREVVAQCNNVAKVHAIREGIAHHIVPNVDHATRDAFKTKFMPE